MKRLLIALVLLGVVAAGAGMLVYSCTKTWKVETAKLTESFTSASSEIKAEVQKAVAAIRARDFETALASLKKVVEAGNLTEAQKTALSDTVTDITVKISENPPPNADALFDMVADITDAIN
jgi:hypothetical protein